MAIAAERSGRDTQPVKFSKRAKKRIKEIDNSVEGRAARMTSIRGSMKRSLTGSGNSRAEKIEYARKNPNAEKYRAAAKRKLNNTRASDLQAQVGTARGGKAVRIPVRNVVNEKPVSRPKAGSGYSSMLDLVNGKRKNGDQKTRESNFFTSQKSVIEKRFGGDKNKALAAMRREAARQRLAASKRGRNS